MASTYIAIDYIKELWRCDFSTQLMGRMSPLELESEQKANIHLTWLEYKWYTAAVLKNNGFLMQPNDLPAHSI